MMSSRGSKLCRGLVAAAAMTAIAVNGASASTGGHFSTEVDHAALGLVESGSNHRIHIGFEGMESQIGCTTVSHAGTITSATSTQLDLALTYSGCTTTSGSQVAVTTNGCAYRLTAAAGGTTGTLDLVCPAEKAVEIHHPNCAARLRPGDNQNIAGIHYTTTTEGSKHAITVDTQIQLQSTNHAGICLFIGTERRLLTAGSLTLRAFDTTGAQVSITAT
jgi:hypothetical protein